MQVLGLCSSWGTSRICPAWSPSEHQLTPALSPFGASVRSHAWRRLFIVLMTAAHISPNDFSLRNFLSNIHSLFLTVHATSFISFIHHICTHIYIFYLHVLFTLLLLWIFMAGRLPSVPCVRYNSFSSCVNDFTVFSVAFSQHSGGTLPVYDNKSSWCQANAPRFLFCRDHMCSTVEWQVVQLTFEKWQCVCIKLVLSLTLFQKRQAHHLQLLRLYAAHNIVQKSFLKERVKFTCSFQKGFNTTKAERVVKELRLIKSLAYYHTVYKVVNTLQ